MNEEKIKFIELLRASELDPMCVLYMVLGMRIVAGTSRIDGR